MRYWVYQDAQLLGPLEAGELAGLAALGPGTLVCREEASGALGGDWGPLAAVPELSELGARAAAVGSVAEPEPPGSWLLEDREVLSRFFASPRDPGPVEEAGPSLWFDAFSRGSRAMSSEAAQAKARARDMERTVTGLHSRIEELESRQAELLRALLERDGRIPPAAAASPAPAPEVRPPNAEPPPPKPGAVAPPPPAPEPLPEVFAEKIPAPPPPPELEPRKAAAAPAPISASSAPPPPPAPEPPAPAAELPAPVEPPPSPPPKKWVAKSWPQAPKEAPKTSPFSAPKSLPKAGESAPKSRFPVSSPPKASPESGGLRIPPAGHFNPAAPKPSASEPGPQLPSLPAAGVAGAGVPPPLEIGSGLPTAKTPPPGGPSLVPPSPFAPPEPRLPVSEPVSEVPLPPLTGPRGRPAEPAQAVPKSPPQAIPPSARPAAVPPSSPFAFIPAPLPMTDAPSTDAPAPAPAPARPAEPPKTMSFSAAAAKSEKAREEVPESAPAAEVRTQEVLSRLAKTRHTAPPTAPKVKKRQSKFMVIITVSLAALISLTFLFFRNNKNLQTMSPNVKPMGVETEGTAPAKLPPLPAAQAPAAPKAENVPDPRPAVIDFVKQYPLDGGRGTVGQWLQYSFAANPGDAGREKWDAGAVGASTYMVEYSLAQTDVRYVFEADIQAKTLKGSNPAASALLAPQAPPPAQAPPMPAAKKRRRPAARKAPKAAPLLPLPSDAELSPPAEDGSQFSGDTVH